jgi:serine-type D-Ala-D-Ala carboxypeptidase/endopeptidase (penicillin-binding protein 4)
VRRARRLTSVCVVLLSLALPATATAVPTGRGQTLRARPAWVQDLDAIVGDRPFSVSVGQDGVTWYQHRAWVAGPPASNEKLLLSMVLLDRFAPSRTIATEIRASGHVDEHGVLRGDLYLIGHGDPEVKTPDLGALAQQVRAAGIRRVKGGVVGATGPFVRDWWAEGWRDYFPDVYIARPTALAFDGNESVTGVHLTDPERRAAQALTGRLRGRGIVVRDVASMGAAPYPSRRIALIRSGELLQVLRHMNVPSSNFRAEVLGKWLAAQSGKRATIAAGAEVLCTWLTHHGADFTCHDASGLSYRNRATTRGIVELLWLADRKQWGVLLRSTLARPGTGTLSDPDRLVGLTVRAKTGTLEDVSALSGWVRSEITGDWIEFSILSKRFDDDEAKTIENHLVRTIANEATAPA